ncbi:MAG TPA: sigma 54-interacting transcriptional regulator [Clostridia bacterium]|nr:sigma 54-interacting transcriptional regulator [Clostridia bacterium]
MAKKGNNRAKGSAYTFQNSDVKSIVENLPTPLFVTDKDGNILLSNSFTAFTLGLTLDELLSSNVQDLVNKGLYNNSYALQAAREKRPVTGTIKTRMGITTISTSTPILDENGEVTLIVTTSKPEEVTLSSESQETADADMKSKLQRELEYLRQQKLSHEEIVAESFAMKQIVKECLNIAKTDSAVLLMGESGTGKDVLANFIYKNSHRAGGPFITINCSAIPEPLFEAELFGYEKGAFTGADANGKMGLLEIANEGTLFLDEISEMPLYLQAKLLRVLEHHEIRRVGGTATRRVNFRLISATNRNLEEMVKEGTFRKDLFYRINVIPITIPPLRERPEDLIALTGKFIEEFNKKYRRNYRLNRTVIQYLLKHNWPGNVRELRNYIEREVVTNGAAGQTFLQPQQHRCAQPEAFDYPAHQRLPLKEFMKLMEEKYIKDTLAECNGRIGETAKTLGIYRTVLYRKLKSYSQKENPAQPEPGND